jgi:Methyltransferase domain
MFLPRWGYLSRFCRISVGSSSTPRDHHNMRKTLQRHHQATQIGYQVSARPADTPKLHRQRALSFSTRAALYDRLPPRYPPQALSPLATDAPARQARQQVADAGAETGKLTAALLAEGGDVDALEPHPRMQAVLTARLPAVRVRTGQGEQLPLPDGSVDAMVYGQAWHGVNDIAGAIRGSPNLPPVMVTSARRYPTTH